MNKTNIEWVKNPDGTQGFTWNPITGCLNHIDGLCKGGGFPCYAYKLANGRLRQRYLANMNCPTSVDFRNGQYKPDADAYLDPFYPRFWEDRLYWGFAELQNAKLRGIFVCDMGELFGDWLPLKWTEAVLYSISKLPQHRFYLLTKQPQNLIKFSPFPDNCWVGVTATNGRMARDALHWLLKIEAKVKYISFEPLLERIYIDCAVGLDWLIIGAQTKPSKPPKTEWVEEIVRAADKVGIPIFLKNNLGSCLPRALAEARGNKYPKGAWYPLRQEMPI